MQFTHRPFCPTGNRRNLPPSPPLPSLLQTVACRWRPFDYVQACRARYGERFAIYPVEMPPLVFLSNPLDVRAIITASPDTLHGGGGGSAMEPLFGASAFMLHEQAEHSSVRNAIMPAFDRTTVQGHADTINDVVDSEVASWPADRACALSPYVYRLTLKVMLMTAIESRDRESTRGKPAHYETLCQRMLEMLSVMASPLLQEPRLRHLPGWRTTWKRFVRKRDEVDELIYTLIAQRRDEGTADRRHGEGVADDEGAADRRHGEGAPLNYTRAREGRDDLDRREDLLDLLIAARRPDGAPMSDVQVRDNLMSVIIAGHETTAATLAWAFQLLAHNRAVQDCLIEEIDEGCSDTYMNAVIQETLRHKPTFLFLPPRVVVQPTEIGGWDYHPPTQMLACTYLMHHDPELYSDPHAFRPERFLVQTPQPGTLLPWGGGRKRCPGRGLALLEIRTVLQQALSRWRVLPVSERIEHPSWRTALLTPHAGSKVVLRPRRVSI
jgi:cytochrome P450